MRTKQQKRDIMTSATEELSAKLYNCQLPAYVGLLTLVRWPPITVDGHWSRAVDCHEWYAVICIKCLRQKQCKLLPIISIRWELLVTAVVTCFIELCFGKLVGKFNLTNVPVGRQTTIWSDFRWRKKQDIRESVSVHPVIMYLLLDFFKQLDSLHCSWKLLPV